MQHAPESVLSFWFSEIPPSKWFEKSNDFDQLIAQRFGDLHKCAAVCELYAWRETPRGRLAEIIVLDQFSRNIHRDHAMAFTCDPLALALAQAAISTGSDGVLSVKERSFLYMPFMHSESVAIHTLAMDLFDVPGLESSRDFERKHKEVIDRFGRFPHRNALLSRESTPQELEFLKLPGSSF